MNDSEWLAQRNLSAGSPALEPGLPLFEAGSWQDFDGLSWPTGADGWSESCAYLNAATCPDCGYGMVRLGVCLTCPACGYGSCGE